MKNIKIVREYRNVKIEIEGKVEFSTFYYNNEKRNKYELFIDGEESIVGTYNGDKEKLINRLSYEDCTNHVLVNNKEIAISGYVLNLKSKVDVYAEVKDNYINNFVEFCKEMNKKYEFCDYIKEYNSKVPVAFK